MIYEDGALPPPLSSARGARRPEHPRAREAIVSPYSVLEGYRWIADADLPTGERAVLLWLFRHVDSVTWRWPPKVGARGGSSLADIATGVGRSVRQARRLVRGLETRGILVVLDRRPARNEYQLLPEGLRAIGEAGLAAQREARAARRAAHVLAEIAADQELAACIATATVEALEVAGEAPSLVERGAMVEVAGAAEGDLPAWAYSSGRRHGASPTLAAGMVRALHAASGAPGSWLKEGELCRRVCRLWVRLGQPGLPEWEALLARVVEARGSGRLARVLSRTKIPAGALGLFALVNNNAVRAAVEAEPAVPAESPAESPYESPPEDAIEINLPAPVGARPGDLRTWQRALAEIRGEIGGSFFDVWIRPLELVGFDGERVLVRCPGAMCATWVAEHYAAHLTRAADGPVRLFFRP